MTRANEPSIQTRRIELKKLIDYAKENHFKLSLIQDYKRQFKELDDELKKHREHRKALRVARNE